MAAKLASFAEKLVKAGVTGEDVDREVHKFIVDHGAYPTAVGFMHFPKSLCVSINEIACHGIPSMRPFVNGDYVNLDMTLYLDGVHGDTSLMCQVGEVHPDIKALVWLFGLHLCCHHLFLDHCHTESSV